MFEVRIHGRGGQGVVTAAELLSVAAFAEGRHAQAFPSFGSERTGAPVVAFCRVADQEIRVREPVVAPDALVVQDATLLHQVDVFAGLKPGGYVLINSTSSPAELGLDELSQRVAGSRLLTIPATDIAREHIGRPVPNLVMLGGLAAFTGLVHLPGLLTAMQEHFPGALGAKNVAAATAAYELVQSLVPSHT
ncbi:MAG: 2-oxoacid:acceptor oxidoreductase family protein [Actinomycetales bacterium]|jgi:pyruvate ferredoxin oxidoreductase gamma subunit|nr:2-oxoacid:acceptor oxidoreductase family protein [Candidatus Phosphoribacter baldrii]MBK6954839.1 2-oxoacid:acceptor oxidoreductase family protein [Candidatus Phosphoribacter baldrii]MBK7612820.1 2-oxoacid:acceptor oxidoreductase family protein [Candidatus Phosphoribacter baldrii]